MFIKGLQKTTLIDYPGKVACTVFLAGCNFRCPWCYAPHLVLPEKIEKQPSISQEEFFSFLEERKELLDGVCVCGGEPTVNQELPQFIKKIKDIGYLVKLDSNGSNPEMLEKLFRDKLLDYLAMDIKAPLSVSSKQESKYNQATGVEVNLNKIKKSIELIKNSGIDYEFRTTLIPGFHSKQDVVQIAKDISPAKKYYLQNFKPEETIDSHRFQGMKPYGREFALEIIEEISSFFEICKLRV
jgi:pyruvate formate lyase activating enzyme